MKTTRPVLIAFRVTRNERRELERRARGAGVKVSEYVRRELFPATTATPKGDSR